MAEISDNAWPILLGIVTFVLFCPCCFWGACRRHIVRDATVPSSQEETTPELRKAHIEATLITRKVVSDEDFVGAENLTASLPPSRRLGEVIESLSSSAPSHSFVADAAFSKIFRSNVESAEPQKYGLELSPTIPMGSSDEEDSRHQTSVSQPNATSSDGNKEESRDNVDEEQEDNQSSDYSSGRSVKTRRKKGNIVARPASTSTRSFDTCDDPTICAVCLADYKVGEDVCWSPNDECVHVYHKNCIVNWLMTNRNGPRCPECQRNYLKNNVDNEQAKPRERSTT